MVCEGGLTSTTNMVNLAQRLPLQKKQLFAAPKSLLQALGGALYRHLPSGLPNQDLVLHCQASQPSSGFGSSGFSSVGFSASVLAAAAASASLPSEASCSGSGG